MERVNSTDTLANVSPFLIKKVVDSTAGGEVQQCKKLLNGSILIETKSFLQASRLIQLTSLSPEIKIDIKEHPGLNYAKGVIYSNDLRGIDEAEIVSELKQQNVSNVNKILKNVDGILKETGLIVITFASTSIPSDVAIGYEKVRVRPYIPLPLKCKNCLQYGHIAKLCKNEKICANCSNPFHTNEELKEKCAHPSSCINCKNNDIEDSKHPTYDKCCPIFLKEKEIQAIATLEKVGKKKAATIYKQRHATQNTPLFSTITKTINNDKPTTSTNMPPPTDTLKPRLIKDYSDVISDIDNSFSEMETDQQSNSSQTNNRNQPMILPKNASKKLRETIKRATRKSIRTSKK